MKPNINIFVYEIPSKILMHVYTNKYKEENYGHRIARELGYTWSHVNKVVNKLHKLGFIEFMKLDKRSKGIILTAKGKAVAECLIKLRQTLR